jgi:Uma2 family endonuclease
MKEYVLTDARNLTVEEYIAFEERSEIRHEFINNQLIPMPGTTDDHNDICINLTHLLKMLLKTRGKFKVHQENIKVQILHERDYTYPDVVVVSDPRDFETRYIKKYPSVIFEVISRTSRIDDQVDKFIRYKNIETLQNYILVDAEKVFVEVRYKTPEGDWEANTYLQADAQFPVPALGLDLAIDAVYEGVSFL